MKHLAKSYHSGNLFDYNPISNSDANSFEDDGQEDNVKTDNESVKLNEEDIGCCVIAWLVEGFKGESNLYDHWLGYA
ncbi:hypothetical protein PPACK8108_LOCUS12423 [Phakopsora pachyrhizi]|uniref:Uncharacterized protein n=1 Tax=Phakopsora pachyrhizi TaxID=170000 RepID=A0AAV0B3Z1_PHAPC|nr:hypothetical protein PPACK8108_LOCUS12423 [Phakopsora pachyrhizi]